MVSTHALSSGGAYDLSPSPEQPSAPTHPILKAFERTECGQLFLTTPEGKVYDFIGHKIGPVAYLQLHDWKALDAFVERGENGFAEGYMDKMWDSPDLPALLAFGLYNADALEGYFYGRPFYTLYHRLLSFVSGNSLQHSREHVKAHYDLGNEFYALWLDKGMTYSCALFGNNIDLSLEKAQENKYVRILDKLGVQPGEHILEIGCGWGGFAEVAAKAGIRVTGVTLSENQKVYADERIRAAGLDTLVNIELKDYRQVEGTYDYVVSIGMFEHVGEEYWPVYFDTVKARLKPQGRAIVQCITIDHEVFERTHGKNGFIETYIFPGGVLPSKPLFQQAAEKSGLTCGAMFEFGQDYVATLNGWLKNFNAHEQEVRALGHDDRFIRMWRMYLASSIAAFTTGRTDVMQAELING